MNERQNMTSGPRIARAARLALSVCVLMTLGSIFVLLGPGSPASAQVDPYSSGRPSTRPSVVPSQRPSVVPSQRPSVLPTQITRTSRPRPTPSESVKGEVIRRDDNSHTPEEILPQAAGGGILPLTGADLTLLIATGASLVGTGTVLVRRSRRRG